MTKEIAIILEALAEVWDMTFPKELRPGDKPLAILGMPIEFVNSTSILLRYGVVKPYGQIAWDILEQAKRGQK